MTEDELKPGAVIQIAGMDQPVELSSAHGRSDGSWFLILPGSRTMVATAEEIRNARLLKRAKELVPVVYDGLLKVPLYHGTNSIWWESIREYGLGGRNVITELGVIELLKELLTISDANGLEAPSDKLRHSAENIATQKVGVEGWNYRHGTTYLCAAPMKAAAYTSARRCGSEAIEYCLGWYEMIHEKCPELLVQLSERLEPLLAISAKGGVPLVLEVRDIPSDILRDERGKDIKAVLDHLSELVTWHSDSMAVLGQSIVVESIGVIPPSCITAFELGPDYRPYAKNVDMLPWNPRVSA
jgi:hypothetical protein